MRPECATRLPYPGRCRAVWDHVRRVTAPVVLVLDDDNRRAVADGGRSAFLAWHTYGMARTRLSTTVDAELLDSARRVRAGVNDAALIDEALGALLLRNRAAELD